jgi:hypothetical protein
VTTEDTPPDFGLVSPLAVPPDSKVPDGLGEGSSPDEYDRYFRIRRDQPGLLDWTRHCLRVELELVSDLERSGLPPEDQSRVLEGLLAIYRVTLERWLAAAELTEPVGSGEADAPGNGSPDEEP